jgi:hypothetical protein
MHNIAIRFIISQYIGDDLTESLRVDSFVDILDGIVHIFFRGRNATLIVPVITHVAAKIYKPLKVDCFKTKNPSEIEGFLIETRVILF